MVELEPARTGDGHLTVGRHERFRTCIEGILYRTQRKLANRPFERCGDCPLFYEQNPRAVG